MSIYFNRRWYCKNTLNDYLLGSLLFLYFFSMAIAKINTFTNIGLEWYKVTVEVDANKSIPTFEIIWLPDAAIKEAKERMRMTFKNTGISLPARKIVLNLAPSDIKKVGTRFDLPMAVGVLFLLHEPSLRVKEIVQKSLFFGEVIP